MTQGSEMLIVVMFLIAGLLTGRLWFFSGWMTVGLSMIIVAQSRGAIHEVTGAILFMGGCLQIMAGQAIGAIHATGDKLRMVDRVARHFAQKIPDAPPAWRARFRPSMLWKKKPAAVSAESEPQ